MDYQTNNVITLEKIKEDASYIDTLNIILRESIASNEYLTIHSLIEIVHGMSPELKKHCEHEKDKFKVTSVKDKGLVGKIIEFHLFGNLPNSSSRPDTSYGDIKTTHFKLCRENSKSFNAKERLTLTNFGDPSNETNIGLISDKNEIQETKFYEKIRKGIIFVLKRENEVYDTIDSIYNKKIISVVKYDLDTIFEQNSDVKMIFKEDFDKIKKCVSEKAPTQRGQKYLHLHKHGCKNSVSRAFGFTNKFLTKLVSLTLCIPIIIKGKTEYIQF